MVSPVRDKVLVMFDTYVIKSKNDRKWYLKNRLKHFLSLTGLG